MDLLIGAHTSIAGGFHRAIERGEAAGCRVVQVFTGSNQQWASRPVEAGAARQFRSAARRSRVRPVSSHACYLINVAASDPAIRARSRQALREEIERAEALGIPHLVLHPGAHTGAGADEGIRRAADSLEAVLANTAASPVRVLLENTAGQGTSLGWRFEELAAILERLGDPPRLGVCLDTCHAFAAGYDLRTPAAYAASMKALDEAVGLRRVRLLHLNDSRGALGSRLDRHEHIGRGQLGREAFRSVLRDRRLSRVPKVLETPKGEDGAEDRRNLAVLRRLAAPGRSVTRDGARPSS